MSYRYRAYGITFLSDTPIEGFFSEDGSPPHTPDIRLELNSDAPEWVRVAQRLPAYTLYQKLSVSDPRDATYTVSYLGSAQFFELIYSDGTEFIIERSGTRLWGRCQPPHSLDYLATYLRGPVMGFLLRQRGVTALHASAIALSGESIVLCGQTQSGKSTTAAALALRGTPVLCDDVTPLSLVGNRFYAEPGYAQLGLWPDAVQDLLGLSDALPRLTPTWEKCFLRLDGTRAKFQSQACPLRAIYILASRVTDAHAPRLEETSQREALLELIQNTYMNWLLDPKLRAAEFNLLSRLVRSVPVRRIVPHSDPSKIAALCDLIIADAESLLSQNLTSVASSQ